MKKINTVNFYQNQYSNTISRQLKHRNQSASGYQTEPTTISNNGINGNKYASPYNNARPSKLNKHTGPEPSSVVRDGLSDSLC